MENKDNRTHRVKSDFGTNDYYRFFRKNFPQCDIDRKTFGLVLKEFNSHVRDGLSTKGVEYLMPCRVGRIELRKIKREVKVTDEGEIINKLPVDWKKTRELWKDNPTAKEKGIKIKFTNDHTDGYTFRITYLRSKANYKNKSIYKMRFNRVMKRQLSDSIFKGRIDAFLKD